MPPRFNPKNNNPPKPVTTGAAVSSSGAPIKASKKSTLLMAVAALLIPPLGLIMALMASVDKKRPKKASLVTILLIASLVGAIGYLGYLSKYTSLINIHINSTKYDYQNGSVNEFSSAQAAGMSFSKPVQFTSTAKKSGQNYSTESFAHLSSINYPLGYIFVFSYKDSRASDEQYIKGVNDFMAGTVKNSYRTEYINAIKKQVFDSYPGYDAKLGEPQKFTNANIKKNAWSFDLDITYTKPQPNSNPQIKPMKGKLVYVLGPGTIYYFSLMVTQVNWTPNTAIWQTVLGSLKLNA